MSKNGNLTKEETNGAVLIKGTTNYYVNQEGNIFKLDIHGKFLKLKLYINKHNGYVYVGIRYKGKTTNQQRRVHILVAETFVNNPSPDKYNIVGHWDNCKSNNSVTNLYWTNVRENTQKAVDDGLMVNDKGIRDSQSIPVMLTKEDGTPISVYGSISEAGRLIQGSSKSSIAKVIDSNNPSRKGFKFKSISMDEYYQHKDIAGKHYEIPYIKKTRTYFNVYHNGTFLETSNNQSKIDRKYGIPQAIISAILRGELRDTYKDYTIVKSSNDYRKVTHSVAK